MASEIVMPRLGWNMEAGTVVEWLKRDGDRITAGEYLLLVEGDKSVSEVEALDSGTLHIPGNALRLGEELPVGTILAYLVQGDERIPQGAVAPAPSRGEPAPQEAERGVEVAAPADTAEGVGDLPPTRHALDGEPTGASADAAGGPGDRPPIRRRRGPVASPRAKRVAKQLGVDWSNLVGSSRSGRIVEQDVRAASARATPPAAATPPTRTAGTPTVAPAPQATATPLSPTRRLIGARMAASTQTAAAVTLTTEADASALVRTRADLAEALAEQGGTVPSYNDFFARLVAVALREFPDLNAWLTDEGIVRHDAVHVGLAVDTERGLLVPVLRDVQAKSVRALAAESARLIAEARAGTTPAADLGGGTFTITNLGMYEIDAFTPIINPPQCAILGIGRLVARPVVVDEAAGTVAVRTMVALSLTFDHRIVDGGPAARFLQRIKQFVERPIVWLTS